jgi:hypothetical protein
MTVPVLSRQRGRGGSAGRIHHCGLLLQPGIAVVVNTRRGSRPTLPASLQVNAYHRLRACIRRIKDLRITLRRLSDGLTTMCCRSLAGPSATIRNPDAARPSRSVLRAMLGSGSLCGSRLRQNPSRAVWQGEFSASRRVRPWIMFVNQDAAWATPSARSPVAELHGAAWPLSVEARSWKNAIGAWLRRRLPSGV